MARKIQLRTQRTGTVINQTSSRQEKEIDIAIKTAIAITILENQVKIVRQGSVRLIDVVNKLKNNPLYNAVDFDYHFPTSRMRPDGGIVNIQDSLGNLYPILIAEVKNQGTNDLRAQEGLPKQAKGNAIERLGKNVIGFRTLLLDEDIFPFVCFGYGVDFDIDSSILDRVTTINMFGPLNTFGVDRQGPKGEFQRGCFYFRREKWTVEEMTEKLLSVMKHSISYYKTKYSDTILEFEQPDDLGSTVEYTEI